MKNPAPRPWTISRSILYECEVLAAEENGARAVIFQGDKETAQLIVEAVLAYDRRIK